MSISKQRTKSHTLNYSWAKIIKTKLKLNSEPSIMLNGLCPFASVKVYNFPSIKLIVWKRLLHWKVHLLCWTIFYFVDFFF